MSGHSHWSGIKRKKEITDNKRGKIFSKLLALITAAAKTETNPDYNPRLRSAIEKARENNVPAENIERAIKKASENNQELEELILEAYGPGGIAILMTAITDNRNRTVAEVKSILTKNNGKWAESGSVLWAFEATTPARDEWNPKFTQEVASEEDANKLDNLIDILEDYDDIQKVFINAQ